MATKQQEREIDSPTESNSCVFTFGLLSTVTTGMRTLTATEDILTGSQIPSCIVILTAFLPVISVKVACPQFV